MSQHLMPGMTAALEICIDHCLGCYATCQATVAHCLERGGRHAERTHITLMLDCARICLTSAEFMLHGSERHRATCAVCAAVCRRCAEDCRAVDPNDSAMQRCADECDRCAESCELMAA